MEKVKLYKDMTPEEQLKWITDFSTFTKEQLPILCALGDVWVESSIKSFEKGLALMNAFAYCRDFIDKSLLFRDFSRRVNLMVKYIDKIKAEIGTGTVIKGANGETLAYMPITQAATRRRGRPSKEDMDAAIAAASGNDLELQKAKAIASLTESVIVAPPAEASTEKATEEAAKKAAEELAKKAAQPSLFDQGVNAILGDKKLHFDQLEWLVSEELRAEMKTVSALRATAASASEQAKALAERNVAPEIIEPHSRAAVEATSAYQAIYARVDKELATLFVTLTKEPNFGGFKTRMESSDQTLEQLMNILRPYYEKMGAEAFTAELEASVAEAKAAVKTPEQVKDEEDAKNVAAAKAKTLHTIRTYMLRVDMKVTPKRVEKMKEYLEEVKSLGEPTEEYDVIIAKAEQELAEAAAAKKTGKAKKEEAGKEESADAEEEDDDDLEATAGVILGALDTPPVNTSVDVKAETTEK